MQRFFCQSLYIRLYIFLIPYVYTKIEPYMD